jgi:hypothetical protein
VRGFLSKSVAGGLSAGVVLLWWPVVFDDVDTVSSWLVRGIAWTVAFELLMLSLEPFERALWETGRGESLSRRVGSAGTRLHSGSKRRRMGRLSLLAGFALIVPVALMVMGLREQAPAHAEAKPAPPVKVVRVTKVVRPVTVKRVVEHAPVSAQPVVTAPAAAAAPREEKPAKKVTRTRAKAVVGPSAPEQRSAPQQETESRPEAEKDAPNSAVPVG